jgi:hypothetical protein
MERTLLISPGKMYALGKIKSERHIVELALLHLQVSDTSEVMKGNVG